MKPSRQSKKKKKKQSDSSGLTQRPTKQETGTRSGTTYREVCVVFCLFICFVFLEKRV